MPVTGVVPSREDESTQAKTNHFGQTQVPEGLTDVIAIAAGIQHSLAVKSDGTVIACGQNDAGQINVPPGVSTSSRQLRPVRCRVVR